VVNGEIESCVCRALFSKEDTFPIDFTVIKGNESQIEPLKCDSNTFIKIQTHFCNQCDVYYCANCMVIHESHTSITCSKKVMLEKQRFQKSFLSVTSTAENKRRLKKKVDALQASLADRE
jgi:hypothetical protein